jgi:Peptidase C26/Sigma-70 region 2
MDLDTLIATQRRPIERHLRRRVGDPSLAEDLAQEVFLRAWLHAPADLHELRMRAWLYRVAIDTLRARAGRLGGIASDGALLDALDLAAAVETEDHDADRRVHAVATGAGSLTRRMVGTRAVVPSIHHQAIDALGRGLRVTSCSTDGIVEGIEDPRHPFAVGVQWHAELPEAGIAGRRVRDALADAALRHAAAEPLPTAA